jgi:hypothetical protein
MTTEEPDPSAGSVDEDQAVFAYLGAIESARAAPEGFLDPDKAAPGLAGAEMVTGEDREGLEAQLAEATPGSQANVRKLEGGFVRAAAGYAARHGMTYESWRQAGVDPEVLAQAGIRGPGDEPHEASDPE